METINQTYFFEDITPEEVYEAYMHENRQATFTASGCQMNEEIGGKCIMYDGYIEAENVKLEPGKLIEQKWVAKEDQWPEGHQSTIRITLEEKDAGTQLTLVHTDVPPELKDSLEQGWIDHYWTQMTDYFG